MTHPDTSYRLTPGYVGRCDEPVASLSGIDGSIAELKAADPSPLDRMSFAAPRPAEGELAFTEGLGEVSRFRSPLHEGDLVLYRHPTGIHVLGTAICDIDIGGKGAGIIGLAEDGFRIPETLLVSKEIFAAVMSDEGGLDSKASVTKIQALLPILRQCLREAEIEELMAIRSSGPEDSVSHTAAGLFRSTFQFLDAPEEGTAARIAEVLDSAYGRDADVYYARQQLQAEPIALLLQSVNCSKQHCYERFVDEWLPEASGVIDTSDPSRVRVSLNRGLCTSVVDGVRCPTYFVDRATMEVTQDQAVYYLHESIGKDPTGNAIVMQFHCEFSRSFSRDRTIPLVRQVAAAACSMERDGMGIDIEFTVPVLAKRGSPSPDQEPIFLQRRPIKKYSPDFILPGAQQELERPLVTDAVIGQRVVATDKVFITRPTLSGFGTDSPAALREYNEQHPEGYALVLQFPLCNTHEQYLRAFQQRYPYHLYSNAKAVIIYDGAAEQIYNGSALTAHFGQFVRSEDLPVMIFNAQTGKDLYHELEARRVRGGEGGSGGGPLSLVRSLGADLFSRLRSNSYGHDLTKTMTIGVDQVAGRGILGFGRSASEKD